MAGTVDGSARRVGLLLVVGLAYYGSARVGLEFSLVEHNITPLWPPTGIAVAAFVLLGRRMWPAVAVAAFLVNLPITPTPLAAAATALGNLLAPLLAAVVLQRFGFRPQLDRQRDAHLVVACALASGLVSATIGTLTLLASGAIEGRELLGAWAVWWTGDAMGFLIVAPLLLAVPLYWERPRWTVQQWAEAALICVSIAAVGRAGMSAHLPVLFPVLPLLGWAAWRLQIRGAAPAALVASLTATWSATHDVGLFALGGLSAQMLTLQAFNACIALMSFVLAALVTEHRRTAEMLLGQAHAHTAREHEIAVALQQTLLPARLPAIPGVEIAARYIPASSDTQVGGDWYDVVPLPEGRIGLVIGDVAGHGPAAAATMGQLRMTVRAYALQNSAPASVMAGLHQLATQPPEMTMTTLLYLTYDPETGAIRYANAGHPPGLVMTGDGATWLDGQTSPPIGVSLTGHYAESGAQLAAGTTLLLYTDGLVERRSASIQNGLDRLHQLAQGFADVALEEVCDALLASLLEQGPVEDDVALLVLRTARADGSPLHIDVPADPKVLVQIRSAVRRWLRDAGADDATTGEILVACGEACNNVVEHAYGAAAGTLQVDAALIDGAVEITVRDQGTWRPEADRGGGWGLDLAHALMQSVEVRTGDAGTTVAMRRSLDIGESP